MVPMSEINRLLGDETDTMKAMIASIDEVVGGESHE